jgi:hypothetical protein
MVRLEIDDERCASWPKIMLSHAVIADINADSRTVIDLQNLDAIGES